MRVSYQDGPWRYSVAGSRAVTGDMEGATFSASAAGSVCTSRAYTVRASRSSIRVINRGSTGAPSRAKVVYAATKSSGRTTDAPIALDGYGAYTFFNPRAMRDNFAQMLIEQFGSVEAALDRTSEVARKMYRESLENNRERVLLSKHLATIDCHVPIEFEADSLRVRAADAAGKSHDDICGT